MGNCAFQEMAVVGVPAVTGFEGNTGNVLGRMNVVAMRAPSLDGGVLGFDWRDELGLVVEGGKDDMPALVASEESLNAYGRATLPVDGARCCAKRPKECCRSVVSDGTIRYLHRLLRAALQDAVTEDELLTANVAKRSGWITRPAEVHGLVG